MMTNAKGEQLERVMDAVMKMRKFDVAALRQAYAG
jgi:predicted 3-demethylubiquinone-9 3-methyltransferase (glyoxalase superfamily)